MGMSSINNYQNKKAKIMMNNDDYDDDDYDVSTDEWTLIEDGDLKGLKKKASNKRTGTIVALSSRQCKDVNRWSSTKMPSLQDFSNCLLELDLYKMRYITHLNDSICNLEKLRTLCLVRCEKLTTLPNEIGKLQNLRELDLTDASELSSIPESIGDLKKYVSSFLPVDLYL